MKKPTSEQQVIFVGAEVRYSKTDGYIIRTTPEERKLNDALREGWRVLNMSPMGGAGSGGASFNDSYFAMAVLLERDEGYDDD